MAAGWQGVWRGDAAASDAAMIGEHRVARSRVLLIGALTGVGLVVLAADPGNTGYRQAVPVNLMCLAFALAFLVRTRRGARPVWLAYATGVWDVSLVSLLHVFELSQGLASTAVNGRVTFLGYFLALVGTCIRWDRRLPLALGALAAAQYAAIVVWSARIWGQAPAADIAAYGTFDPGVQIERIATLLLFALVCRSIVDWALDLRHSAVHDVLTGLLNRRTFEARLRDELLARGRSGQPVSVAMLDVDNFKQINDRFGHGAGDRVLKGVAEAVRQAVRRSDVVARWGGEEFAVVLPETPIADAAAKVEAIRAHLAGTALQVDRHHEVRLTVSAGVASAPADGTTLEALTQAADDRLLEAKRAGRDRVVAARARVAEA